MAERNKAVRKLGLYLHIPFCASRCAYCDFCSTAGRRDLIPGYQVALKKHLTEAAPTLAGYQADSVYFGGGTPSWYGADYLLELLGLIRRSFRLSGDCEITLEANPDSVRASDLLQLRKGGFNRISLGAQSANDAILRFLGRRHNWAQVPRAVDNARRAGFENVSLDLIYGLPAQSREDWTDTLRRAMDLRPEHLSCYGLKLEEGTPLWKYRNSPDIPGDELQADMYLYAVDTLAGAGYIQYEISNFAQRGFASRHNLKYWLLEDYAGFGASAASSVGRQRFTFLPDAEAYIQAVETGGNLLSESETVTLGERAAEYVMLGLRTTRGIAAEEYERRFRSSFASLEALLQGYVKLGLAKEVDSRWRFTPRGFLLSNRLIGELLDAQAEQRYRLL